MVLWQSDLRVSWRAQWLSLLAHGLVALFVLLLPWPMSYTLIWMFLLSLVVFDSVRSQRRINASQGKIKILTDSRLKWQGKEWDLIGTPWLLRNSVMLRIRPSHKTRCQHLWLLSDSMDGGEWRDLRRLMIQQQASGSGQA